MEQHFQRREICEQLSTIVWHDQFRNLLIYPFFLRSVLHLCYEFHANPAL